MNGWHRDEAGRLVSLFLKGFQFRQSPPPSMTPLELGSIADILLRKRCGPLAWWRLRKSSLRDTAAFRQFQDAYRLSVLYTELQQERLLQAFEYFRGFGVEPLLAKGWSLGRLYAQTGLRPYGDLDLSVLPSQYPAARRALERCGAPECGVELHRGFRELRDREGRELFRRSKLVELKGTPIRVLGAEDHLRLLCLHGFHHGLWSPLVLCDVAVFLESLPGGFDWDACLAGDGWLTRAVGSILSLMGPLLGSAPCPPVLARPPSWLPGAVLSEWGQTGHYMGGGALGEYLTRPRRLLRALWHRWPNPIRATFTTRAPLNDTSRLPYQLAECVLRAGRFLAGLPHLLIRTARWPW